MSAPAFKVGDRVAAVGRNFKDEEEVGVVGVVVKVGARVRLADGSEWHVRAWDPGRWVAYGKTRTRGALVLATPEHEAAFVASSAEEARQKAEERRRHVLLARVREVVRWYELPTGTLEAVVAALDAGKAKGDPS